MSCCNERFDNDVGLPEDSGKASINAGYVPESMNEFAIPAKIAKIKATDTFGATKIPPKKIIYVTIPNKTNGLRQIYLITHLKRIILINVRFQVLK